MGRASASEVVGQIIPDHQLVVKDQRVRMRKSVPECSAENNQVDLFIHLEHGCMVQTLFTV